MAAAWELNQVSILMPLPEKGAANDLWRDFPLPRNVYESLPRLTFTKDADWLYDNLRVVAVRIDPCFVDVQGPCQRQIRFVWQPLENTNGGWRTIDAAVHSFHTLNENSWRSLAGELARLNKKFPMASGLPLTVHPVLKAQGLKGEYGRELERIFKSRVSEANLTRATAMTVNAQGTLWTFAGFDVNGEQLTRLPVPKTDNVAQAFFVRRTGDSEYVSRMNPEPQGEKLFLTFLADSAKAKLEMSSDDMVEAVRKSFELSNPRRLNPGQVDCASCHSSRAVPDWAALNFPNWNPSEIFKNEIYRGPGNLTNITVNPLRTDVLRAFGYFGADPVVSPRVIHETSLVVERMDVY
jgi:hypothetical protein